MTDNTTLSEFIAVLRTRRELCRAMRDLALAQSELIERREHTELIALVGRKQEVINKLQESARLYGGLADYWKQTHGHMAADVRNGCQQILNESEQLLAQAIQAEADGTQRMQACRDATQKRLQELSAVVADRRNPSGTGTQPVSRFLDVSR